MKRNRSNKDFKVGSLVANKHWLKDNVHLIGIILNKKLDVLMLVDGTDDSFYGSWAGKTYSSTLLLLDNDWVAFRGKR